jgi:hypothetical protein
VLRSLIYGLIAIVLIVIVADLFGRRRTRPPAVKRKGKSRAADDAPLTAWGSTMNPRSDFPATTFSDDDAEFAAKERTDSPPGAPQRRPARNHFAFAQADAAPIGAASRVSGQAAAHAHLRLHPVHDPLEKALPKREARETRAFNSVRLLSLSGPDRGKSYPVVAAGTIVGRHPSSHIVVGDRRVSGQHARLGMALGKIMLCDLDSTNGTMINAHPNRVVGETELHSGDTIYLGGHKGAQFQLIID